MRKFLGYFLTFLLALSVTVPVVALAAPATAEARFVQSLPTARERRHSRTRVSTWHTWNSWTIGVARDVGHRNFTFQNSWNRSNSNNFTRWRTTHDLPTMQAAYYRAPVTITVR